MSGLCSAIFLVILSLYFNSESTKCPETALFAPRRKHAACKAALRHHRITAPRSPFSGILKLGSGERRRYPMVFLCGIYFVSFKPSCALSFNSDRRPATCPDGLSPLARVCISSFCMTCLEQKKKRGLLLLCVLQWKMKLESRSGRQCQSASAAVGWTGLQSLRSLLTGSIGRQKGTLSEDKGKSLLLS